jgi:cell division protease FtsH
VLVSAREAREFLRYGEVREAVGIELGEAEASCRALLESNRSAFVAVARRLFERGRIRGAEVAELQGSAL